MGKLPPQVNSPRLTDMPVIITNDMMSNIAHAHSNVLRPRMLRFLPSHMGRTIINNDNTQPNQ